MINSRLLKSKIAYNELTINELATLIGVTRDTISNVINKNTIPSYKVIMGFYRVLKLTPEELVEIFFNEQITH